MQPIVILIMGFCKLIVMSFLTLWHVANFPLIPTAFQIILVDQIMTHKNIITVCCRSCL